jgi:hypothetical protein
MHTAAADFDEEQHIQSPDRHGINREEIHREGVFGLRTEFSP